MEISRSKVLINRILKRSKAPIFPSLLDIVSFDHMLFSDVIKSFSDSGVNPQSLNSASSSVIFGSCSCFGCSFINQFAITGTKVCESKNEITIENPIANAKGKNNAPGIPTIVNAGAKTAKNTK